MLGDAQVWLMVLLGLAGGVTCLALALWQGRKPPVRTWAWIAGLVLLGVGEMFRLMIGITTVIQESWADSGVLVGAVAAGCILAAAVLRPRLAAWFLLGTAVVLPLVLLPGFLGWFGLAAASLTPIHVLGFFGLPATVTSGLLFVATQPVGQRASESGTQRAMRHRAA